MSANYKNFPFHLIGCAVLPLVGAYTQSVRAVFPDPSVVEAHWRKNPKIFHETFDALFPQAEKLSLYDKELPDWFEKQKGKLFEIRRYSDGALFHTLDDLNKLPCDAELKKIIKVVGSQEFLEKVLPKEVMESIFAHVTGGEEFGLKTLFKPCFDGKFFNPLGMGSLDMAIKLSLHQEDTQQELLVCCFRFDFKKRNTRADAVILESHHVRYASRNNDFSNWNFSELAFYKKTDELSRFPWSAAGEAKKKFSHVYAQLRKDLKDGRKKYKDCEICHTAKNTKDFFEFHMTKSEQLRGKNYNSLLDILVTEDFLKGIFGEELWNIIEHSSSRILHKGLGIEFQISRCINGFKVSFLLHNCHMGNRKEDVVIFNNSAGFGESEWKWLDFLYIHFCFLYNPEKDEISDVRLQDKLILNYKTIQKCNKKDGFLLLDYGDEKEVPFGEPTNNASLKKKHGDDCRLF